MPEIFNKIDKIKPAYDLVYKAVMLICKLLLVADIVITSMSVVGSNRSTTLPSRSIKNFVKFHLISAPFTSIFA